ncbi:ComEA family DNA-binding protein [Rhodococcus sp. H29-C3]|uniref:ComEA family DNA-binding protein n=1 Tax=Rhodococcus sp. H29-C3 TaxID=3046307 RepID=UPI0024B9CBA3|nr:ComEA family DNA-binding protein [Rhodococcus sp. H29-C3]MDJ0360763.1 ComEA family DNA-binding protein [Rhodococcus sp. H29-C3]
MARPEERLRSLTGSGSDPESVESIDDASAQDNWLDVEEGRTTALSPYLPERWRGARLDPGRKGMFALCGVGLLVVLVAGFGFLRDSPEVVPVPPLPAVTPESGAAATPSKSGHPSEGSEPVPAVDVVVSVVGLVSSSGLIHLPPGSRVADALAAAGGPLDGADVLALNLAAKVTDGDQIVVGAIPPDPRPLVSATVSAASGTSGAQASSSTTEKSESTGAPVAGSSNTGTVNLNTATVTELDALSGVGPVTAANIVSWREVNGPFTDVTQLGEVDGIGPVRLEKLRSQVFV